MMERVCTQQEATLTKQKYVAGGSMMAVLSLFSGFIWEAHPILWMLTGVFTTATLAVTVVFSRYVLPLSAALEHEKACREPWEHTVEEKQREAVIQERIDALSQAVARAESANQAKSDFLANMSHELRTPLHAIHSFAHLILKRSNRIIKGLEDVQDPKVLHCLSETIQLDRHDWETHPHLWLTRIMENTNRQLSLVDTLLDLAKLESGNEKFDFQAYDLSQTLASSVEELESLFRDKGVHVTTLVKGEAVPTLFDHNKMRGVIKNLLCNALKFTPRGGEVTVCMEHGLRNEVKTVLLTVQDSGPGIEEHDLERIFEPFAQSVVTHGRNRYGGSGLGLSICKEVVSAHGGTISASNHPGGGAIFTVVLPHSPPTAT